MKSVSITITITAKKSTKVFALLMSRPTQALINEIQKKIGNGVRVLIKKPCPKKPNKDLLLGALFESPALGLDNSNNRPKIKRKILPVVPK